MKKFLLVVIVCCFAALASAQEIVVAAAADLSCVFPEVAARFEKETGHKVKANFGSSGNFLLQIENGAPIDVFFSADVQYPQRLESEGLTQPGSIYKYAIGKLVLYVPANSPLNLSLGLHALQSPEVKAYRDCQSATRSLWARGGGSAKERRALRCAAEQVCDGRKHLAGRAVCAIRRSRCRHTCAFARSEPGR